MSSKKKKMGLEDLGMVFSTNPDYKPEFLEEELEDTPEPKKQHLKVMLDKKMRKGKVVTLITGFIGHPDDLKDLGKLLKSKCGVGGTVKDEQIIIQGEHRDKIIQILKAEEYNVKRVGG